MNTELLITAGVAVVAATIIAAVIVTIVLGMRARNRRFVAEASAALAELERLNATSLASVPVHPPIRFSFAETAASKAHYDRFDLVAATHQRFLAHAEWFEREVVARITSQDNYVAYRRSADELGARSLGRSSHPKLSDRRFATIEAALFDARRLPDPVPDAQIVTTVRYTSPQGRNAYARRITLDFNQLRNELYRCLLTASQQSTTAALRAKERSRVTASVRMDVLRRDGMRCRMCGASSETGAQLHVDHIVPISHDGLSDMSNLQTLCMPCNRGKSNRFVG